MHTKTFVIEMPDSIDIQPETIVYALSYISNHDFVVKEAAQQSVQADGLKALREKELLEACQKTWRKFDQPARR